VGCPPSEKLPGIGTTTLVAMRKRATTAEPAQPPETRHWLEAVRRRPCSTNATRHTPCGQSSRVRLRFPLPRPWRPTSPRHQKVSDNILKTLRQKLALVDRATAPFRAVREYPLPGATSRRGYEVRRVLLESWISDWSQAPTLTQRKFWSRAMAFRSGTQRRRELPSQWCGRERSMNKATLQRYQFATDAQWNSCLAAEADRDAPGPDSGFPAIRIL